MPPHEILTIVRSTGMEPVSRPIRQGPAYVLRALDPAGEEVRVIVDARRGRIVKVAPVMMPRYAVMPPPYGRPPRPIPMVPDGYGPNARIAGLPPSPDAAPSGLGGLPAGAGSRSSRRRAAGSGGAGRSTAAAAAAAQGRRDRGARRAAARAGTAPSRARRGHKERQHRRDPGAAAPIEMHE